MQIIHQRTFNVDMTCIILYSMQIIPQHEFNVNMIQYNMIFKQHIAVQMHYFIFYADYS